MYRPTIARLPSTPVTGTSVTLQSRNGVKVNGVRVTEKRLVPGDILSIARHKYEVRYSPMDLGAVGPPRPTR